MNIDLKRKNISDTLAVWHKIYSAIVWSNFRQKYGYKKITEDNWDVLIYETSYLVWIPSQQKNNDVYVLIAPIVFITLLIRFSMKVLISVALQKFILQIYINLYNVQIIFTHHSDFCNFSSLEIHNSCF